MPPRRAGSLGTSRSLARRITYERERQGWKQSGLARRMTEAGYAMTQSTISKIENDDPPRRITVDELIGFSLVFGIRADELMLPPEVVTDQQLRRLVEDWRTARLEAAACRGRLRDHLKAYPELESVLDDLLSDEDREALTYDALRAIGRWRRRLRDDEEYAAEARATLFQDDEVED